MARLLVTPEARDDLERLRSRLAAKSPRAARRAGVVIAEALVRLRDYPQLGRPVAGLGSEFREVVVDYGESGYVARYRYDGAADAVVILRIRHQREAGYGSS